ncbi:hypothetical protein DICPUDRAFT_158531 [Dictyostelium purpureum]|uniref:THUMP domain-containing protein n=1 Tax=Dictyostelium purpureum TaxID=5786 RepID=F1A1U3_DICPU|nr:uncharacterized protein DICPUDRAFT_158531 [Dictyostelium purpureum]EGC29843.1 hypothetical protein DICPUDRAFT_158531 [Dictyostelium purpureum]|eukprot:XP_003293641.1 hypothetical protein DICPUDRAFT_158531 [Dictyostelium purpureum]
MSEVIDTTTKVDDSTENNNNITNNENPENNDNKKRQFVNKKERKQNKKIKSNQNNQNKERKPQNKDNENQDVNDYDEKKVIFRGKFKSWKKHSRLFATDEKVKGLLICCDSTREAHSIGEILPILNNFADKYFPKENTDQNSTKVNSYYDTKEQNLEGTTENSGTEIKKRKRFELINSGCSGIYFISMTVESVSPIDFMNCMFIDTIKLQLIKKKLPYDHLDEIINNFPESTKKMLENADQSIKINERAIKKVTFTSKVQPILQTCCSVDLNDMMKGIIENTINKDKPKSFAIEIRSRNNIHFDKHQAIKDIAAMVDPSIKVNLKFPDTLILIEVVKSSAVASVIPQYRNLFKLNLRELVRFGNSANKKVEEPESKVEEPKVEESKVEA